jgi:dTDP-4-dehydrorhamnose reductase
MLKKPIVIIGATGQLGTDLMRLWPRKLGDTLVGLTHQDIEVTDSDCVRKKLHEIQPHVVVNTSAYHRVDEIETSPEKAFAVNAIGPGNLAAVCREMNSVLVHLSTDYVFSGTKGNQYVESDPVDPVNLYGSSKAAGEMIVRYRWRKHFIVRTSGLYGISGPSGKGSNFVDLMLRLAQSGKPIKVVNDQVLTPTPTHLLAEQIAVLSRTDEYGTYHATCQGECSWYAFARTIFNLAGLSPIFGPQTTAESGAVAIRPEKSVLQNKNLGRLGIDQLPHWETGLRMYLRMKGSLAEPAGAAAIPA